MAKEILAALWIWLPIFARLQEPDQSSEQPCAYFSFSMFLHISYYFLKHLKEFVAVKVDICLEWMNSYDMNHIRTDGRITPLKLTHRREALIQYSNTNQSDPWHNFEALASFNIDALFRSGVPLVDTTIRLCTSYCSRTISIATGDRL